MEKSFARRSFLLVMLALFLGFLVTVAASPELPFLPPLDHVQPSTVGSTAVHTEGTQYSFITSRLIRKYFKEQVRWSPFLERHAHTHHTHQRVVREYRPRPNLPSTQTSKKVNCEMGSKLGQDLAARQFHLRGKPSSLGTPPAPTVPHLQTIVEVTGRPAPKGRAPPPPRPPRQHIPVELASQ